VVDLGEGIPLILGKKEEITEGLKQAGQAKQNCPPPLAQGLDLPLCHHHLTGIPPNT